MCCTDPVSRCIPCWGGMDIMSLCTSVCLVLVVTHQWLSELKQKIIYVHHTSCRAPGPHCPGGWVERRGKQHVHYMTTILPPPPRWSQWEFVQLWVCFRGNKEERVPVLPLWHLHPLLPSYTKVSLHPDCHFCSEKDLTYIVLEEHKTPLFLTEQLFPGAIPQKSIALLQPSPAPPHGWFKARPHRSNGHLESITRPLLPLIDERPKCAQTRAPGACQPPAVRAGASREVYREGTDGDKLRAEEPRFLLVCYARFRKVFTAPYWKAAAHWGYLCLFLAGAGLFSFFFPARTKDMLHLENCKVGSCR